MLIAIVVLLSLILFNSLVIMLCMLTVVGFTEKINKLIGKSLDIVADAIKEWEKGKNT